jgi:hypothetical protein
MTLGLCVDFLLHGRFHGFHLSGAQHPVDVQQNLDPLTNFGVLGTEVIGIMPMVSLT